MTLVHISQPDSWRPRIEQLLVAQMRLRHQVHVDQQHLFEVERALDELSGGDPTSHTETVERWVVDYLAGR